MTPQIRTKEVTSILLVSVLFSIGITKCQAECTLNMENWMTCSGSLPTTDQMPEAVKTALIDSKLLIIFTCTFDTITNVTFANPAVAVVKALIVYCSFDAGGQRSLKIEPGALDHLTEIQALSMSDSNIASIAENTFCSLSGVLHLLSLTQNVLDDISQLQLGGGGNLTDESSCARYRLRELLLSNNRLHRLDSDSFTRLPDLQKLLLNGNRLTAIQSHAFKGLDKLEILDLSGNRLTTLPAEIFPISLTSLDVSNNLLESSFYQCLNGLSRLDTLNASVNHLTIVDGDVLRNLTALHTLHLEHNGVATITDGTFRPHKNQSSDLYVLALGNNGLSNVTRRTLLGLENVTILLLNDNRLCELPDNLFSNFRALKLLRLNGNGLTKIPTLDDATALQELELSHNRIGSIGENQFAGNPFVRTLLLRNNSIARISSGHFRTLTQLDALDLSSNSIDAIESSAFADNEHLVTLRLDHNVLSSLEGIFPAATTPMLANLNLSNNVLTHLDWRHLPVSLTTLSVSHNRIERLGSLGRIIAQKELQQLDASYNRIHTLDMWSVPESPEILLLNHNRIAVMDATWISLNYGLQLVDLRSNRVEVPCQLWFRLAPMPQQNLKRRAFLLAGNPLRCTCDTLWLNTVNGLDSNFLPIIADVDKLTCRQDTAAFYNLRLPEEVSIKMAWDHYLYLCRIDSRGTNTTCSCKSHLSEPLCQLRCPFACTCYRDNLGHSVMVDCSSGRWNEAMAAHSTVPANVTMLRVDGSFIPTLRGKDLSHLDKLRELFLNATSLRWIEDGAFVNASQLILLNLNGNQLTTLSDEVFDGLTGLKSLSLSDNRLYRVSPRTFTSLIALKMLTLNGNRLTVPADWILPPPAKDTVRQIILGDNPWSCKCEDMEEFRRWIELNSEMLQGTNSIKCWAAENQTSAYILDYNKTDCLNVNKSLWVSEHQNVIIGTFAAVLVLLIAILAVGFVYRLEIQVLLYSHCGVRLFHGADDAADRDKVYDAFVSYSNDDAGFVAEELVSRLEGFERADEDGAVAGGNYRLCLHQRDFAVGSYISDSIVEAVEQSRRTIVVLTKNFVESEWCRFEFEVAHHQMIKDRRQRLIVIVVGDVPTNLGPTVGLYMKTNTYLNWKDKLFWQKLYFAMPEKDV